LTPPAPRLVVAGTGGDSGKTLVALAITAELRRRDLGIAAFKKGPDYIDAAWLSWAAGSPAHNLDTFLMGPGQVRESFAIHAAGGDVAVVEGNRGLLDGMDERGTHSTAVLAEVLAAPVLLVLPARKVTRTVAAWVAGLRELAPRVRIAGVVLNRVAGARHARIASAAVEALGVAVLGVVPPLGGEDILPGRHLGLVTPAEHGRLAGLRERLASLARDHLRLDRILELARDVEPLAEPAAAQPARGAAGVRIGVFRDSAFTFYYPDNLEALEREGASLVDVSALADRALPDVDALIIGGGFPETHAAVLAANEELRCSVRRAALAGLPVYAECGGLMYLSRALHVEGRRIPMAGVLPFEVAMRDRPQGHGYSRARVDRANAFFAPGTELRGHEFHYSTVAAGGDEPETAYAVERGTGLTGRRDAATYKNVLAAYIHLHARGCPEWAPGIVRAASRHRSEVQRRERTRSHEE
jgi:cobyrinic acid a,c-diamide synthase